MEITYEWRSDFDNAELNALHAEAFNHRPLEEDWQAQEQRHRLGWVCARDGSELVGFVNVPWDGGIHAFLLDTMVSAQAGRKGIGTRLVEVAVAEARATACGSMSTLMTTCERSTSKLAVSRPRTPGSSSSPESLRARAV
jgi:ribosomal protein S18 acetylase RimI-like enzyme